MKLLAFSDLHRDTRRGRSLVERSHDVDVVVGAGDFASVHRGLEETIAVLRAIDGPTILVPGNNETEAALRAACDGWTTAQVLHGTTAEIDGVPFFGLGGGVPVTPWAWSFDLSEAEAEERLADCPEECVLVLHSPPKGHVDGRGLGSKAILRAIEAKRPRLAVCGHVHEAWGQQASVGPTPVINLGPDGTLLEV